VNITRALSHEFGTTTKGEQKDIIITINTKNQELDLNKLLANTGI
jgi:hypothetical protein